MSSGDNSDDPYREDSDENVAVDTPAFSGWGGFGQEEEKGSFAGWGNSSPKEKGKIQIDNPSEKRNLLFFLVLKDVYPSLTELSADLDTPGDVQLILTNINRVQHMSWGEFLHSALYRDWLHRIITGREVVRDADYAFARTIIDILPGLPNLPSFQLPTFTEKSRGLVQSCP